MSFTKEIFHVELSAGALECRELAVTHCSAAGYRPRNIEAENEKSIHQEMARISAKAELEGDAPAASPAQPHGANGTAKQGGGALV